MVALGQETVLGIIKRHCRGRHVALGHGGRHGRVCGTVGDNFLVVRSCWLCVSGGGLEAKLQLSVNSTVCAAVQCFRFWRDQQIRTCRSSGGGGRAPRGHSSRTRTEWPLSLPVRRLRVTTQSPLGLWLFTSRMGNQFDAGGREIGGSDRSTNL